MSDHDHWEDFQQREVEPFDALLQLSTEPCRGQGEFEEGRADQNQDLHQIDQGTQHLGKGKGKGKGKVRGVWPTRDRRGRSKPW